MKNWLKKDRASGFTIIEVMIVLAIAGLIMVIVFIAIPQLQRNQRDNARQNVANRVEAEMETFAGNNQGQYPFDGGNCPASGGTRQASFISTYYNALQKDNPSTGTGYELCFPAGDKTDATTNAPAANQLAIYRGSRCSGENTTGHTGSPTARSFALVVRLDNGNTFYCVDNS